MRSLDPVTQLVLLTFACYLGATYTLAVSGNPRFAEFMLMTFPPLLAITAMVVGFEMARRK